MSNDNGVSPVIAVILMVAITVILAAVIAASILDYAASASHPKTIAVSVQYINEKEIRVVYVGGPDAVQLLRISATVAPASGSVQMKTIERQDPYTPPKIGSVLTFNASPGETFSPGDRVKITARYIDGSEQIVSDQILR